MQIQNITNSQFNPPNFNGKFGLIPEKSKILNHSKIDIIPGDLSYEPAKNLRKSYDALLEMLKDKPYNLYIRQDHKNNTVKMTAQKENHFVRNKGPKAEGEFSATADLYEDVAVFVMDTYEKKLKNPPKTLSQKFHDVLNKIGQKFLVVMEIKEAPVKK